MAAVQSKKFGISVVKQDIIYVVLLIVPYKDHGRCRGSVASCTCRRFCSRLGDEVLMKFYCSQWYWTQHLCVKRVSTDSGSMWCGQHYCSHVTRGAGCWRGGELKGAIGRVRSALESAHESARPCLVLPANQMPSLLILCRLRNIFGPTDRI